MFTRSKPKSELQTEIDRLVLELKNHPTTSDQFGTIVERLSKLHKIQEDNNPESINPNTALTVAANIIGIAMILRHEHLNVVTSKALSFVQKTR